ncbi:MAG: DUF5683 domain-containing protein [bacterium]
MRYSLIFLTFLFLAVVCAGNSAMSAEKNSEKKAFLTKVLEDSTQNSILRKPRKKSPTGALVRTLFIPGWGQWYNEQKVKAVVAFSARAFLVGLAIYYNNRVQNAANSSAKETYRDRRNLTYWLIGGVTLISMLDAYVDAYLFDFDEGPDLSMRMGVIRQTNEAAVNPAIVGFSLRAKF